MSLYKLPFRYEPMGATVFDSEYNMVSNIMVKGRLRNAYGQMIAAALNMSVGNKKTEKTWHLECNLPFRYEDKGQYILDTEDMIIASVRGWGRIQYMENPEHLQDSFGELMAKAMNIFTYWEKQ